MADTHGKHHDYHLVDPSPWPVIASAFVLMLTVGIVAWMKTATGGVFGVKGPWLFSVGGAGIIFTAFMWWRDVIREAHKGDHTAVVQLHLRYGMIMFIASEVMFFVAWFWAYFDHAFYPGDVHTLMNSTQQVGMTARNELFGGIWPPTHVTETAAALPTALRSALQLRKRRVIHPRPSRLLKPTTRRARSPPSGTSAVPAPRPSSISSTTSRPATSPWPIARASAPSST